MNGSGEREGIGDGEPIPEENYDWVNPAEARSTKRGGRPIGASSHDAIGNIDGVAVRTLRLEKDWTQKDLGREADLSKGTISDIERRKPGFKLGRVSFDRLARTLGVEDPGSLLLSGRLPGQRDLSQPPTTVDLLYRLKGALVEAVGVIDLIIQLERRNTPQ
jgi:transcriptional regulator with XRE-family HTH domain